MTGRLRRLAMSMFSRMLNGSRGCHDLLMCLYELNALETAAYFALLRRERAKMEDLAADLERERSTVYRAVQKLMNLDLAQRETITIRSGGYYFVYEPTPPAKVRELIEQRLAEFESAVRCGLDAFEEEVAARTSEAPTTRQRTASSS